MAERNVVSSSRNATKVETYVDYSFGMSVSLLSTCRPFEILYLI